MDEFKLFIQDNKLELAQDDIDDKTFMAICGILVINDNKALSPLEIAHELQSRNWNGFRYVLLPLKNMHHLFTFS